MSHTLEGGDLRTHEGGDLRTHEGGDLRTLEGGDLRTHILTPWAPVGAKNEF